MQYELGMPHFKWYWRLQQSCSNQSSCLFWKLRDASPLHFKWTQSDERCTFEKYLFCILGGGGESIFLCLSLIKKAKTRICLYTENRLKKHLVCSMNRRNDYIKSTLKWVDFASLKGFVSDRVGKKDDLAGLSPHRLIHPIVLRSVSRIWGDNLNYLCRWGSSIPWKFKFKVLRCG